VTVRLPKLPLSMTAVAVVTPSSGSNSALIAPVVVGADTCPSLFAAAGPVAGLRSPLVATGRLLRPERPVFDRSPREVVLPVKDYPDGEGHAREPLPRTGPLGSSGAASPGPVRRMPHERGDRPGGTVPSTC
jgi:hypothetical protein